jgi:hypothetical protein
MRRLLLGLITGCLAGCYTPNQSRFDASVHRKIAAGMPLATAVTNLGALRMTCYGDNPVICDRIRQRLLPSSCIERVSLTVSHAGATVNAIKVDSIVCAGL